MSSNMEWWLQGTCAICGQPRSECQGQGNRQAVPLALDAPLPLTVDPSPAATAVRELFATIKDDIEEPDGSWPGADVVEALSNWFTEHGFDIESNSHTEESTR